MLSGAVSPFGAGAGTGFGSIGSGAGVLIVPGPWLGSGVGVSSESRGCCVGCVVGVGRSSSKTGVLVGLGVKKGTHSGGSPNSCSSSGGSGNITLALVPGVAEGTGVAVGSIQ